MAAKEIDVIRSDHFVEMVERLATNEAVDTDKLQKLVDIQMQVMDRNAEAEFNAAMSRVQANLPTVTKDAENQHTHSTFARHEAISRAIKPIYTSEGFSTTFSQGKADTEGYMRIKGLLRHRDGHKEPYWIDLPPDDKGSQGNVNKTALHAAGSTFTYGRRYLTLLMFDVATGDDTDGNLPVAGLNDDQALNIQSLLEELPKDTQEGFWDKAHVKSLDDLVAHRYPTYVKWLEQKRAAA